MQIYADVTGKEIRIAGSTQAGALGSAIYAAVAAGVYPDVKTAAERMGKEDKCVYRPIEENREAYGKLYEEYRARHDYFGRGVNGVMERLRLR